MQSLFKKKNNLIFPSSEIEIWKELKHEYIRYGYEWTELEYETNTREIRRMDNRNIRKFNSLKKNENTLRNSVMGILVPYIVPPPKPDNYERYRLLKKWNKNSNSFNISMAAIELYKKFGLEPCRDYEPSNIMNVYYANKTNNIETLNRNLTTESRSLSEPEIIRNSRYIKTSNQNSIQTPITSRRNTIAEPSAPPPIRKEDNDENIRKYHLRETGYLITEKLPPYNN